MTFGVGSFSALRLSVSLSSKKLLATKSTMRRFDRCFGRGLLSKRWFCLVKIFLALLNLSIYWWSGGQMRRRLRALTWNGNLFSVAVGMDVLGVSDQADDTV